MAFVCVKCTDVAAVRLIQLLCWTPPCIPEVYLPEEPFIHVASALTIEINRAFKLLQDVASGRNLK
ncbi:hypothetical protein F3Y22_tig00110151pilonHSYRG00266 [Hibiscus syriacus]|uniref:Uncharacterized protein n=1 Tax=Hibiscus syriacus TaxID=106335 RepID=A0A6A3BN46_HIBSY|nr:hypothetical protein F3Y22_tig00110151pilonHSYRG00266 [Hibiscus syriacus]